MAICIVCSPKSFFLFLSTTLKDISTSLSAFEDDSLLHFTKEGFSSSYKLDKEEWDEEFQSHTTRALNKICEKKNRRRGRSTVVGILRFAKESPKR